MEIKALRGILWEVCLLLTVYYRNLNCLTDTASIALRYGGTMKKYLKSKSLLLKKNKNLNAQVFITVGSREGEAMVPKMTAFADSLKLHNYIGLTLTSHVFEDEGHFSVVPASISRTLRVLYKIKRK